MDQSLTKEAITTRARAAIDRLRQQHDARAQASQRRVYTELHAESLRTQILAGIETLQISTDSTHPVRCDVRLTVDPAPVTMEDQAEFMNLLIAIMKEYQALGIPMRLLKRVDVGVYYIEVQVLEAIASTPATTT